MVDSNAANQVRAGFSPEGKKWGSGHAKYLKTQRIISPINENEKGPASLKKQDLSH